MTQPDKAAAFRRLHEGPAAFILPNAWDAGSARLLHQAGFAAIGTTSAGIAFSLGLPDEGALERDAMLAAVARIAAAVPCPVSADLERGFGDAPAAVGETVARAIAAGLAGCNIEDGSGDPAAPLIPVADMAARVAAARRAADAAGLPFVVNARTDGFWTGGRGPEVLGDAIARGRAYAGAGADCVFVPLLREAEDIARACAEIPAPVNVLALPGGPTRAALERLGVRRISTGGGLARACLTRLVSAAAEMQEAGSFGFLDEAMPHAEMMTRMRRPV